MWWWVPCTLKLMTFYLPWSSTFQVQLLKIFNNSDIHRVQITFCLSSFCNDENISHYWELSKNSLISSQVCFPSNESNTGMIFAANNILLRVLWSLFVFREGFKKNFDMKILQSLLKKGRGGQDMLRIFDLFFFFFNKHISPHLS